MEASRKQNTYTNNYTLKMPQLHMHIRSSKDLLYCIITEWNDVSTQGVRLHNVQTSSIQTKQWQWKAHKAKQQTASTMYSNAH